MAHEVFAGAERLIGKCLDGRVVHGEGGGAFEDLVRNDKAALLIQEKARSLIQDPVQQGKIASLLGFGSGAVILRERIGDGGAPV
jgi:hypothetical protein